MKMCEALLWMLRRRPGAPVGPQNSTLETLTQKKRRSDSQVLQVLPDSQVLQVLQVSQDSQDSQVLQVSQVSQDSQDSQVSQVLQVLQDSQVSQVLQPLQRSASHIYIDSQVSQVLQPLCRGVGCFGLFWVGVRGLLVGGWMKTSHAGGDNTSGARQCRAKALHRHAPYQWGITSRKRQV